MIRQAVRSNFLFVLLVFCLSLSLSGCIATAMAAELAKSINWQNECGEECKDPIHVVMYHQDGKVADYWVSVRSMSRHIGCVCPAPVQKE